MGKTNRKDNRQHDRFKGDSDCNNCKFYQGHKRGCKLDKCCFDDEKLNAIAKGKIKRVRRTSRWDM